MSWSFSMFDNAKYVLLYHNYDNMCALSQTSNRHEYTCEVKAEPGAFCDSWWWTNELGAKWSKGLVALLCTLLCDMRHPIIMSPVLLGRFLFKLDPLGSRAGRIFRRASGKAAALQQTLTKLQTEMAI